MTTPALEMRLTRNGPPEALQPVEVTLAAPGPGEALVAIEAAGVAYADVMMRQGLYPGVRAPVTPGYDFVGRIEAVGAGVAGFAPGDRVAAVTVTGSYASRRLVPALDLVPAPAGDAVKLVAGVLNGLTAFQMARRLAVAQAGETVLVHGAAGGVGAWLLDLARLAGVTAVGTASAGKKAVVEARGAHHVDYRAEDVAARARALSDGGVVAAYDHIGGGHVRTHSMAALRRGGVAVIYGAYDLTRGGKTRPLALVDLLTRSSFNGFALMGRSQGVVGYNVQQWRDARRAAYRADLVAVLDLVARGTVDPLIGETLRLRDAPKAHALLERASVAGKIVLTP